MTVSRKKRLEEAKAQLTETLIQYGRITGRPEAFETALLLNLLDTRDPRVIKSFDSIPLVTT